MEWRLKKGDRRHRATGVAAETGVGFTETKIPFREVADIVSTREIRTNRTGGILHLFKGHKGAAQGIGPVGKELEDAGVVQFRFPIRAGRER